MTSELFLLAIIAGQPVAIRSDQVESVVDIGEVTPVPLAAAHVCGLAALRSRVVTVIDPCAALGLGTCGLSARRAIITQIEGHHYAIFVDSLDDVTAFEARPMTNGVRLGAGWADVVRGLVERDGAPIPIIDLPAMLPASVARAA